MAALSAEHTGQLGLDACRVNVICFEIDVSHSINFKSTPKHVEPVLMWQHSFPVAPVEQVSDHLTTYFC